MRFPKSCRIGCFHFAIAFGPQQQGDLGRVNIDQLRIGVDDQLPPPIQAETILHEALHAMLEISGLTETQAVARHEEQIVRALSPLLFGFLADNPVLVRELQKAAR